MECMTQKQISALAVRLKMLIERRWPDRGGQSRAAEAFGVTPANLSRYLSGKTVPTTETLMKMAEVLGVSLSDLEGVGPKVSDKGTFSLPNCGWVPAGKLADAATADDVIRFHEWFGGNGVYTLDVRGDSMMGAGIFNHDVIVVRPAEHAAEGDIVVAEVNGEKTVKQFNMVDGKPTLLAFNDEFPPVVLTEHDNARLVGVVIGGAWLKKRRRVPTKPTYEKKATVPVKPPAKSKK
jgi:repressor LexA